MISRFEIRFFAPLVLVVTGLFPSFSTAQTKSVAKKQQPLIQVNIPTVDAEVNFIWRTIQDTKFFEENNYSVRLPKAPLVDELKGKAKSGTLNSEDFKRLQELVKSSVYKQQDYQAGYKKIKSELALVNKMVGELKQLPLNWKFKFFETYQVNLTLYGPGGSYNSDEGSLVIQTTPEGRFKGYSNPANTIIHEITHMGIEDSIIQKYQVPHSLKERIVDSFVLLSFKKYLPTYKLQNMGDHRIDPYLKKPADLANLEKWVKAITGKD